MSIRKIGIIGEGVMGSDIAFDLSSYNYKIILKDLNDDILRKEKEKIKNDLKLWKLFLY